MAASTVPTAKARLVTLFTTAFSGQGVSVTWAAPTDEQDYVEEMVWLGDVRQEEEFRVISGPSPKIDEEYVVDVHVQALKEGDDPQATEERAWVLREACITALRADLTLGGILNQWAGTFPTRMEVRPADPKSWLARATIEVTCRARI